MPDSDMRVRTADPDSDAEAIAAIYRPAVEASAATFEERAPTITQMAARIRHVLRKTPWLVAEDASDGVIGYAYARLHHERVGYRWSVDVSAYVRPDRHGRGVGRVMYDALLPILRRQNFVNVYAGIALPNPASVALHESIGMRRRLRAGRLQDGRLVRRSLVRHAARRTSRLANRADSVPKASRRVLTLVLPEASC